MPRPEDGERISDSGHQGEEADGCGRLRNG
jgi:hypothetical protein